MRVTAMVFFLVSGLLLSCSAPAPMQFKPILGVDPDLPKAVMSKGKRQFASNRCVTCREDVIFTFRMLTTKTGPGFLVKRDMVTGKGARHIFFAPPKTMRRMQTHITWSSVAGVELKVYFDCVDVSTDLPGWCLARNMWKRDGRSMVLDQLPKHAKRWRIVVTKFPGE